MILADDLGWSDTTLYGSTNLYQTPNLERLAERGMLFTRAYAASPLCSPTRASVLTGQSCARNGHTAPQHHLPVRRMRPEVQENAPAGNKALEVKTITRLDTKQPTLGKLLREGGYRTAHFGKWHLGPDPFSPLQHSFEIDLPYWASPGPGGNFVAPWTYRDFKPNSPDEHIEDRMAKEAVKWMETVKDEPFYLQFWQFSVHAPFDAKEELVTLYQGKIDVDSPQRSPTYAAMVHSLDDAVGTLLDAIDRLGIADRTMVIFSSDNGGNMYNGIEETGPDGQTFVTAPTSNTPLRGGKATMFEGGIRVPQIIVWPGVTKPDSQTNVVTQTSDFYPTILAAAGIPLPTNHPIDGVNIRPLLEGKPFERGPIYTYFPHSPEVPDWLPPSIAVHLDDWKLIRLFHQGENEAHDFLLYNLKEDIGETNNLAASMPEKVRELDAIIQSHIDDVSAVVPLPNPAFRKAAYRPEQIGVQRGGLKMSETREERLARIRGDAPPRGKRNQSQDDEDNPEAEETSAAEPQSGQREESGEITGPAPEGVGEVDGWRAGRPTVGLSLGTKNELVVHSTANDPWIETTLTTSVREGGKLKLRIEYQAESDGNFRSFTRGGETGPFSPQRATNNPARATSEWEELDVELPEDLPVRSIRINMPGHEGTTKLRNIRLIADDDSILAAWFQ